MTKSHIFAGRVIFDHLPKTAGQAINSWLTSELGSGCVTPNLIGDHQNLIQRYGGEYSLISAHVHFLGNGLDPRYHYITALREPLDRALSWLFFVLKNHKDEQLPGLWELVERFVLSDGEDLDPNLRGHISNPYVEHFSNVISITPRSAEVKFTDALSAIEQYDVWGLYEEMPTFLQDVAVLIGLPAPSQIRRVNVTHSRPAVEQISSSFYKRLDELNKLDIEFYRFLCERWNKKYTQRTIIALPKVSSWVPYNPVRDQVAVGPTQVLVAPIFALLSATIEGNNNIFVGQTLRFSLEFSLAIDVTDLEVSLQLLDENGRLVFSTNTRPIERPLLQVVCGAHCLHYDLIAELPEGRYTAGFTFTEHNAESSLNLARYDKLIKFQVHIPKPRSSIGYVDLPVKFGLQKTNDIVIGLVKDTAGTLIPDAVLGSVITEETFNLSVRLRNDSAEVWGSTLFNPIKLSYHWLDQAGNIVVFEGKRTPLTMREILPGQTYTTQMQVVAPNTPDRYRLMLLPVQEKHCWFDKCGFTPGVLEFEVAAPGSTIYDSEVKSQLLSEGAEA
ncbi:Wzt carbohydrate-binding domain-containing protein [Nitrosomonas communis]|uniref:Wzt C-terminal domain-containing protein n=1 Tax=Nitrosomonas communis TaxID=44574 RepID=A0A1H2QAB5_9PROT|nr:Wzt carbohydrate-binding domain-containing protein [Nitrosomonas communis]SDW03624.1 Wzt C-terminal domain-containing protein [Nitrosomonas communis]